MLVDGLIMKFMRRLLAQSPTNCVPRTNIPGAGQVSVLAKWSFDECSAEEPSEAPRLYESSNHTRGLHHDALSFVVRNHLWRVSHISRFDIRYRSGPDIARDMSPYLEIPSG